MTCTAATAPPAHKRHSFRYNNHIVSRGSQAVGKTLCLTAGDRFSHSHAVDRSPADLDPLDVCLDPILIEYALQHGRPVLRTEGRHLNRKESTPDLCCRARKGDNAKSNWNCARSNRAENSGSGL